MTIEKIPMTAAGYTALEAELKHCQQVERPRIIQQITEARTHGDLSENAEYHAAKEQQSLHRGPYRRDPGQACARRGHRRVEALRRHHYVRRHRDPGRRGHRQKAVWQIVGEPEANAKQGRISITSPLARALIGKSKGATVEVNTPGGAKGYEIKKVDCEVAAMKIKVVVPSRRKKAALSAPNTPSRTILGLRHARVDTLDELMTLLSQTA